MGRQARGGQGRQSRGPCNNSPRKGSRGPGLGRWCRLEAASRGLGGGQGGGAGIDGVI